MTVPHLLNLGIHIAAGATGICLGVLQLLLAKGGSRHRRVGQYFMFTTLTVTATALIGTIAFRFMPLFAVLTLLTTYVAISGWRVARTQSQGPEVVDLAWTTLGVVVAAALVPVLLSSPHVGNSRPVVVWSTLGAMGVLLGYDLVRWIFPRSWFRVVWLPEHIYKVLSAFAGMVSAFVGNVVPWGQPWSQVAPSAIGMLLISYFIGQSRRRACCEVGANLSVLSA
jgi:uncharacterized membrane protein